MFSNLKYPEAVKQMYEILNQQPFTSEEELEEFVRCTAEIMTQQGALGTTPAFVDAQLEIGVLNGYSVEYQLALCSKAIAAKKAE